MLYYKVMKNNYDESFINQLNPLSIASVGDAVHTLFVRESLIKQNLLPNRLHLESSKLCRASYQAKVFDKLSLFLDDKERSIVNRARNHKTHSCKSSTIGDYKKATAFEALIGYLYLTNKTNRLNELLCYSINMED